MQINSMKIDEANADALVARKAIELRNKFGLSQKQLAVKAGVAINKLQRLENGHGGRYGLGLLSQLADVFGLSTEIRTPLLRKNSPLIPNKSKSS
jgi:transcriptional regulator with XRE-family HTH domain